MPYKNSYVKLESNLYLPCIKVVFLSLKLRAMYFKTPKYVPVDKMPPTSRSWFFDLQVNTWKNLETKLPVERSGYQVVQGTIEPIITDIAPDELLRDIRYSCQRKNRLCSTCCCSKRRLPCSIHCKHPLQHPPAASIASAKAIVWMEVPLRFLNMIQSSTPFIQITLLLLFWTLIKTMDVYFVICTHICIFP